MGHSAHHHFEKMPTEDHSDDLGHASPYSTYLYIFIALLVLTVLTVAVTRFDFGNWNLVVAMLIASVKAMLVALYFMHLKYEKLTTWIYAAFPIVLLAVMMGGIFIDNPFRTSGRDPALELKAPVAAVSAAHH
jgi:cytochrome c oxidase subunit 4